MGKDRIKRRLRLVEMLTKPLMDMLITIRAYIIILLMKIAKIIINNVMKVGWKMGFLKTI